MTNQTTKTNSRVFQIVERSAFSLAPSGTFAAALVSLAFLGEHTRTVNNGETEETKVLEYVGLGWEILDKNSGEVHTVVEECSLSYNPDSKLYSRILSLNAGKPLAEGQELRVLLGKSAKIVIIHRLADSKDGGKRMYANVNSAVELTPNMQPHALTAAPLYYDVLAHDGAAFEKLNKKHQNIISKRNGGDADMKAAA